MFIKLPCLALVSALLCSSVSAVTLNDFTPRVSKLTGSCQQLYTSNINGCQPSDFAKGECSVACVSALHALGESVRKACSGQGGSGNIIASFQNGQGARQLCPHPVAAASSAASKSPTIGSSTMVLSSTNAPSTGLILDTSSSPPKSSTTSKAPHRSSSPSIVTAISTATLQPTPEASMSTTSTVGSALAFDTHTPSDVPTSSTKTHAAKHTSSSEGGSPFDSAESTANGMTMSAAMLMSAVVACLLVLQ